MARITRGFEDRLTHALGSDRFHMYIHGFLLSDALQELELRALASGASASVSNQHFDDPHKNIFQRRGVLNILFFVVLPEPLQNAAAAT